MRRTHQTETTLLALVLGITGAGYGCTGSDDANSESNDVLGPANSTATSTNAAPSSPATLNSTGGMSPSANASTTSPANPSATSPAGGSSSAAGDPSTPDTAEAPSASATAAEPGASASASGMGMGGMGGMGGTMDPPDAGPIEPEPEPEPVDPGTCTESKPTGRNATGTGPHEVVIETNSEDGIKCGTIIRPADLGGAEKYPIFVWGEGGCSQNGYSNVAAMAEIASWGYFVVADGTPNGDNACQGGQSGASLLAYITWAINENAKPCSAYYESLDPSKVASDGFSCGGLMSENIAGDPRLTAVGITSSGLMGANARLWDSMHAPFKIMNGGPDDIAYQNGLNDYDAISSRGIPILYFSKTSAGHGGDLNNGRGDFNLVNLAWLNWQLKGNEGPTGKAFLIGPTCEFCNDGGWVFKSANIE